MMSDAGFNKITPRLTLPGRYLVGMLAFLILVGFLALIMQRGLNQAFMANPGLNGLIIGLTVLGALIALSQVTRLYREVAYVNSLGQGQTPSRPTRLLGPMETLLGPKAMVAGLPMTPSIMKAILESAGSRLDEGRGILRYLAGLLVFLGLLGTFWGLIETVGSIGSVIQSLRTGGEAGSLFDELKAGLAKPLAGMGLSFSSSLFGLAGSLIVGFLDLQAGQSHNRFYAELEEWLAGRTSDSASGPSLSTMAALDLKPVLERLQTTMGDLTASRSATQAMANLAEGIQGLVNHMRAEQQQIRDWVEAQGAQRNEMKQLLERIEAALDRDKERL